MSMRPIVHIVDDDESLRMALTRLLQAARFEVRGYASAGDFLLADATEVPGCLLLDVYMPGPSGLDLQKALAKRSASMPIVFLTGHGDIPMSVRAIKAGAVDFLTKPVKKDALLAAVRNAIAKDEQDRTARDRMRRLNARAELLTPRERAVFAGVVAGKLNKQIAAKLGMAERTVKAHRAQIMRKLDVHSVAELVRIAEQLDLTTVST